MWAGCCCPAEVVVAVPSRSPFLQRIRAQGPGERMSSPLLRERMTWIAITSFWIVLGLASWWLEYALSLGSPDGPVTIGRAAVRLVYAALWWGVSVFAVWLCDAFPVRHFGEYLRCTFHILIGGAVAATWAVLAHSINVAIIPGWLPLGGGRMFSATFIISYFGYMAMVLVAHGIFYAREFPRQVEKSEEEPPSERAQPLDRTRPLQGDGFVVVQGRERGRGVFQVVWTREIEWIEAKDGGVLIHTGSEAHRERTPLAEVEANLEPGVFLRVHRSRIVNRARIQKVESLSQGEYAIILASGRRVATGRSYRKVVEAFLNGG